MGLHGGERWGCLFKGCVWGNFEIPILGSRETLPAQGDGLKMTLKSLGDSGSPCVTFQTWMDVGS